MLVVQCVFSPSETSILSVIGQNVFKTFKTADNHLKAQPSALAKRDAQTYKCQTWIVEGDKERIVIGTDTGEILVVEGSELKTSFSMDSSLAIESIVAHSKVSPDSLPEIMIQNALSRLNMLLIYLLDFEAGENIECLARDSQLVKKGEQCNCLKRMIVICLERERLS